jgi:polar amino acid transport system permease protein
VHPEFLINEETRMRSSSDILGEITAASRARATSGGVLYTFPWWLLVLFLAGILSITLIVLDGKDLRIFEYLLPGSSLTLFVSANTHIYGDYQKIFNYLIPGVAMTVFVSVTAYILALGFGLVIALIRANPPMPANSAAGMVISFLRLIVYQIATLYVSVLRGLPILVVILSVAFVLIPAFTNVIQATIAPDFRLIGSSPPSAIIALALTYSAFLSETLRAGIQSIEKGQNEAARSLGMTYVQTMRFIILPQAIRRVLPSLGNDFISMIKDSSLVTVLGIADITQNAKLWSSSTFRFGQTYFIAAMIYLTMTVLGSLLIRYLERRFSYGR